MRLQNIDDIKEIANRYPKTTVFIKYSDIYNYQNPFLSKVLGTPYWEQGAYPMDPDGEPMAFLAQINFEYLLGMSPLFPERGILQFFVSRNSAWGMDFKELYLSGLYSIKYWPAPDNIKFKSLDLSFDDWEAPVEHTLRMHFQPPVVEFCGLKDTYYADIIYGDRTEWSEEMDNFILDTYDNSGSKIGGYASFNEMDPRTYDAFLYNNKLELPENSFPEWILLFQMDSNHPYIHWGEQGTAYWFINKQDLLARRFDRILYTWSC